MSDDFAHRIAVLIMRERYSDISQLPMTLEELRHLPRAYVALEEANTKQRAVVEAAKKFVDAYQAAEPARAYAGIYEWPEDEWAALHDALARLYDGSSGDA